MFKVEFVALLGSQNYRRSHNQANIYITLTADTTQTGNSTSGTHHQRRSEKTNYTSWECREVDNRNESQEGKRTKGKWIDLVKDITHKGVQGYTRKVA